MGTLAFGGVDGTTFTVGGFTGVVTGFAKVGDVTFAAADDELIDTDGLIGIVDWAGFASM